MRKTDQQDAASLNRTQASEAAIDGNFKRMVGYTTEVWQADYAEIALIITPDHMNSLGYVHGGVYATLLDAAFGHAIAFCAVPGNMRRAVTTQLTTTYLSGAQHGRLTAYGRVLGVEGRIATAAGEVVLDDGTVCARGQASFLYLSGSEKPEGVPKPKRPAKS
jgi:uncharacterized protein (TIGR00369 family)